MKVRMFLGVVALCLVLPFSQALAQDAAPADWGELAGLISDSLGLSQAAEPSDGDPAINALNLLGVGKTTHDEIFGLTDPEAAEPVVNPDGFDPNNWPADQELTTDFLCQLKLTAWAAAFVGNVPGFDPPIPSNEDGTLTPAEEQEAQEVASSFVALIIGLAQRDAVCINPPAAAAPAERCFDDIWHWEPPCEWIDNEPVCTKVWDRLEVNCETGEPLVPPVDIIPDEE